MKKSCSEAGGPPAGLDFSTSTSRPEDWSSERRPNERQTLCCRGFWGCSVFFMDEACARRGFDWKHSIAFYTNSNFRFRHSGAFFCIISAGRFRALCRTLRGMARRPNNHCASVSLGAAAIVLNAQRLIFSTAIVDSILLTAFLHSQTRARARAHRALDSRGRHGARAAPRGRGLRRGKHERAPVSGNGSGPPIPLAR